MNASRDHRARLVLVALCVGLAWQAWAVTAVGRTSLEHDFPSTRGLPLVLGFASAALVPAWCLRRRLAALSWRATLPATALGLLLGAACFGAAEVTGVYLVGGGFIEEVRMEPTLAGKLLQCLLCALVEAWDFLLFAALTAPLSLPLAWLSLVALRAAAAARPTPRAALS